MPRSKKVVERVELKRKKAIKKFKGQVSRYGEENVSLSEMGFSQNMLTDKPSRDWTSKQIKEHEKMLDKYLDRKNPNARFVHLSDNEVALASKVNEYLEIAKKVNKYKNKFYAIVSNDKYQIVEKGKNHDIQLKEADSNYIQNKLLASITPVAQIRGRKMPTFGNMKVPYINDKQALERATKRLKDKFKVDRIKARNLKKNYLQGLENSFGSYFSNKVKRLLTNTHITNEEFVYLFYHYEVFDFGFIYSSIDVENKMESIKTVLDYIKGNDEIVAKINAFTKDLSNLEKTI